MTPTEELFDICTEDGIPTGETVARSVAHRDGIRHRTVHIWITRMHEGRKQVLLQKRSMNKDSFPGLYDTSSAGHMQAGCEPLESAARELHEELGIPVAMEHLKFAGNCHIQYELPFHGSMFKDDEVVFLYVYDAPVDINDIVIQEDELEAVEWFDLDEVYNECNRGERHRFCVPMQGLELLKGYLMKKTIYLAGGCFWGMQKYFDQFDGVVETEVGYANGPDVAPSYEDVCNDSGHAETLRVVYDEARISLRELLEKYFMVIDPLSVNRQGHDTGIQYRTGIYYTDESQLPYIMEVYNEVQDRVGQPLAVVAEPLRNFFSAEEYHQKYLDKNPGGYCHIPNSFFKK